MASLRDEWEAACVLSCFSIENTSASASVPSIAPPPSKPADEPVVQPAQRPPAEKIDPLPDKSLVGISKPKGGKRGPRGPYKPRKPKIVSPSTVENTLRYALTPERPHPEMIHDMRLWAPQAQLPPPMISKPHWQPPYGGAPAYGHTYPQPHLQPHHQQPMPMQPLPNMHPFDLTNYRRAGPPPPMAISIPPPAPPPPPQLVASQLTSTFLPTIKRPT